MLEGILRFGDKTANEVMTPRVDMTCVDLSPDFDEVMSTVVESGYSRLPACDGSQGDIKGVLYSRDLLPYIGKDAADFDWRTLLREPYFVPEARSIDDLLEDFRRRHIHMAIVIDEFGGTQGLVTWRMCLRRSWVISTTSMTRMRRPIAACLATRLFSEERLCLMTSSV